MFLPTYLLEKVFIVLAFALGCTSPHRTLYHIVSYRIVSYRIASYHIISHRITSHPESQTNLSISSKENLHFPSSACVRAVMIEKLDSCTQFRDRFDSMKKSKKEGRKESKQASKQASKRNKIARPKIRSIKI